MQNHLNNLNFNNKMYIELAFSKKDESKTHAIVLFKIPMKIRNQNLRELE